jgi:hypothetical protein
MTGLRITGDAVLASENNLTAGGLWDADMKPKGEINLKKKKRPCLTVRAALENYATSVQPS